MSLPYRVVIADDHQLLANGIIDLLNVRAETLFVGQANSPETLKQLLRNQDANILILDYRFGGPVKETHDLVKWVVAQRPQLKIIMYSQDNVWKSLHTEFPQEIQGYVLKNDNPEELIEAIQAVGKGLNFRSTSVTAANRKTITPDHLDKVGKARVLTGRLTKQQRHVLIAIAKGKKNREIAEDFHIAETTAETHRRNIKRKLEVSTTMELREIAELAGLI